MQLWINPVYNIRGSSSYSSESAYLFIYFQRSAARKNHVLGSYEFVLNFMSSNQERTQTHHKKGGKKDKKGGQIKRRYSLKVSPSFTGIGCRFKTRKANSSGIQWHPETLDVLISFIHADAGLRRHARCRQTFSPTCDWHPKQGKLKKKKNK